MASIFKRKEGKRESVSKLEQLKQADKEYHDLIAHIEKASGLSPEEKEHAKRDALARYRITYKKVIYA